MYRCKVSIETKVKNVTGTDIVITLSSGETVNIDNMKSGIIHSDVVSIISGGTEYNVICDQRATDRDLEDDKLQIYKATTNGLLVFQNNLVTKFVTMQTYEKLVQRKKF